MNDEKDRDEILDENAKAMEKLRDLTNGLEAVIQHEQRIVSDPPEITPPSSPAS